MPAAADPAREHAHRAHRELHGVAHLSALDQPPERHDVPGVQPLQAVVRGQHHLVAERAGRGVRGAGAFDKAVPELAVVGAGGVHVAGLDVRDDLAHERGEHAGGVRAHAGQVHRPDQPSGERVDDRVPVADEVAQDLREVLFAVDEHPGAGLQSRPDPVVAHGLLGERGAVVDPAPQQHAGDPCVVADGPDDPAVAVRQQEGDSRVAQDGVQRVHHRAGGLDQAVGPAGARVRGARACALRGEPGQRRPAPRHPQLVLAGSRRGGW